MFRLHFLRRPEWLSTEALGLSMLAFRGLVLSVTGTFVKINTIRHTVHSNCFCAEFNAINILFNFYDKTTL